jgi:hypothetical protein
MTFGRPCMMPNCIVKLDLPINQNLEKLTMLGGSAAGPSSLGPPDTVCFFTATMCASAANSASLLHFANRWQTIILCPGRHYFRAVRRQR